MNPKLAVIASRSGGVFSRREAVESGYTASQIRDRLGDGRWRTVRRGHYYEPVDLGDVPQWEKELAEHRRSIHAVMKLLHAKPVAVSHQSALVLHKVPVWQADLSTVHVTRVDGKNGRAVPGLDQHASVVPADDIVNIGGLAVASPARAVVEAACVLEFESAVVSADAALAAGLITRAQAARLLETIRFWPGSASARAALHFADPRSESVGESRLRVLFDRQGLPAPETQVSLTDRRGKFVARVDFYFREYGVVVEFDGLVKYRDAAADVVVAEKRREDRLRERGLIVVRVIWDDLDTPEFTAQRARDAFDLAAAG